MTQNEISQPLRKGFHGGSNSAWTLITRIGGLELSWHRFSHNRIAAPSWQVRLNHLPRKGTALYHEAVFDLSLHTSNCATTSEDSGLLASCNRIELNRIVVDTPLPIPNEPNPDVVCTKTKNRANGTAFRSGGGKPPVDANCVKSEPITPYPTRNSARRAASRPRQHKTLV